MIDESMVCVFCRSKIHCSNSLALDAGWFRGFMSRADVRGGLITWSAMDVAVSKLTTSMSTDHVSLNLAGPATSFAVLFKNEWPVW